MTKNVKSFVEHVKSESKKYGIKVKLKNVKYLKLDDNIRCSGYFDEEEKVLAVAMNSDIWLGVLVHEYCHLTQWVDNCKEWKAGCRGLPKVDEWLGGKNIKNIDKYLNDSRDLELDNEKRAVKLIKKWGLDVDTDRYTQKANAYVQFYNWMKETRRWATPKNSPYRNETIISSMPKRFNMNYEVMGEKYRKIYKSEGI